MRRCLAVLVFSVLAACGGKSPTACCDAADAALKKGNFTEAQAFAEEGLTLEGATADASTSWRLERIRLEALAGKGELAAVLTGLAAVSTQYPGKVDDQLYAKLGTALADANKLVEAIELVEAGKQAFPDKAKSFDGLVAAIKTAATSGNDSAAVAKLKALGYL